MPQGESGLFDVPPPEKKADEKKIRTSPPKIAAIRRAVSIKKGSGSIFIIRSSSGYRIHRVLSKRIWWKTRKYFVKSVDMITVRIKATVKKIPVPMQRE